MPLCKTQLGLRHLDFIHNHIDNNGYCADVIVYEDDNGVCIDFRCEEELILFKLKGGLDEIRRDVRNQIDTVWRD